MADKDFRVKLGLHVGANAYIEGNITSVDLVQMNVASPATVGGTGQLAWNIDENTLDLGMNANTTLQIGQEQYFYVKNQTGSLIPNRTAVMAAGTVGMSGRIKVAPALANNSVPSKYIIGITTEDIPDGGDGFVTTFGKIRKVDTSMFVNGDILYADPAVPGGLSNTVPIAPNNIVTLAIVVNSDNTNGELFVRPTYGSSLFEDESTYLRNIQDGQAIVYVSANARFENKNVAAASSNSFATISVSGQSNVVADSSSDILTIAAGSGISITTDATTDTITITNTGGGGAGLIAGDYVVRATKQGGSQTINNGADTVVTFADDFDPQGWFASDKFQPTVAGYYTLYAQVWWDAGSITNNQNNIQFRKNGTTQLAIVQDQIVTGAGYAQTISTITYFNGTTDYVEVTAYTGNTTSQNINSSGNGTFFTAALYAYGDAANSWVNANDYTTLLSARSNDFNTLQTAYANDYATLLAARSNDYSTLLTAQANDYSTLLTAQANDYNTLLTARSNDYSTLISAQANDFNTLLTARSNDFSTLQAAYANDFALYSSIKTFNTFSVAGQSDVVADSFGDTVTLVAGSGITITTNPTTDTITFASTGGGGGSSNSFSAIAVSGQSTISAQTNTTLNISAGSNIILTTDASSNTLTISATGGGGGGGVTWLSSSSNYTVSSGQGVFANTQATSWTLTLPASPTTGDTIYIIDSGEYFDTNPLTVNRNGKTIMYRSEDLILDVKNISLFLVYTGADWRIG